MRQTFVLKKLFTIFKVYKQQQILFWCISFAYYVCSLSGLAKDCKTPVTHKLRMTCLCTSILLDLTPALFLKSFVSTNLYSLLCYSEFWNYSLWTVYLKLKMEIYWYCNTPSMHTTTKFMLGRFIFYTLDVPFTL